MDRIVQTAAQAGLMKALFCHDHFYERTDTGTVLSKGQFHNSLWQRYLNHFDGLTVLGRDGGLRSGENGHMNVAGCDNVAFRLFPNTNSLQGILSGREDMKLAIRDLVGVHDCVILRGISEIGTMAYKEARRQKKTVAVEMIACPWDEMRYYGSAAARFYAPYRYWAGRRIALNADAALYVSRDFLQRRYPSKAAIQTAVSNVRLDPIDKQVIADRIARIKAYDKGMIYRIGMIGALGNRLKGIAVALQALALLKKQGFTAFSFHVLGPGDPSVYRRQIIQDGLENHVFFDGIRPSGDPVLHWLRNLDLYIQPSFQEGVPRALIEAMAQGLPAIGARAGGIPELLDPSCLIQKGNAGQLADKIRTVIGNQPALQSMALAHAKKAADYTANKLDPIRDAFWSRVSRCRKG